MVFSIQWTSAEFLDTKSQNNIKGKERRLELFDHVEKKRRIISHVKPCLEYNSELALSAGY